MNKTSAGFLHGALVLANSLGQRAAVVGLTTLAARALTADQFGLFAYQYSTVVSLAAFSGEALALAVYRFFPTGEDRRQRSAVLNSLLTLVMVAGLLGAALVGIVLIGSLQRGQMMAAALCMLLTWLMIVSPSVFAVVNKLGGTAFGAAGSTVSGFAIIAAALVVVASPSVPGYMIAALTGAFLTLALNLAYLLKKGFIAGVDWSMSLLRTSGDQRRFVFATGLTAALGGPVHWCCIYFLSKSQNGFVELATFTVFFQWYLVITFVPSALSGFIVPRLVSALEHSRSEFRLGARRLLKWTCLAGMALVVIAWASTDTVVSLYGTHYANEGGTFLLAVAVAAISSARIVVGHIFVAAGKVVRNFVYSTVYSVIYVVGTSISISFFHLGAQGLYWAILAGLVGQFLAQVVDSLFFASRRAV